MTDTIPRAPGCVCTHEQGDSDCAVHPRCPSCNESLETTRLAVALSTARDGLRNGERVCAELVKERDAWRTDYNIASSARNSACEELERLRTLVIDTEFYLTRSNLMLDVNRTLVQRLRAEVKP